MPPRTRVLTRAAAAVAVLLVTVGCADQPADHTHHDHHGSSTGTASQSPSASTSAQSPTSPSPSRSGGGPLLTAAELPSPGGGIRWLVVSTTRSEPRSFGTCQRFGILAIGAERVVVRRFRPADTGESPTLAGELVATFPDEMTARRAYAVLETWHHRCAGLLRRYTDPGVGAFRSVSVGDAQAGWYLLTYGPVAGRPGKVFLDTQGMALVGKRIAMLSMIRVGANGDAPPPMAEAVAAAASRL